MNTIGIVVSLLSLATLASSAAVIGEGRVLGGIEVGIENYPYIVSVRKNDRHFCGGSIISPNTILTAAHCFNNIADANEVTIRAGATANTKGESIKVALIVIHANYNRNNMQYDVALMRLQQPLIYGPTIKPIGLATQRPAAGTTAVVIGWGMYAKGSRTSENLRAVAVPLIHSLICDAVYADVKLKITSQMICAGNEAAIRSSCPGDSGGPLLDTTTGTLLGIVSFGKGCGNPAPGVYASVPDLRQWIVERV